MSTYKIRAVAVIITMGPHIVAFKRSKDGLLGLPCGKVEFGESLDATAIRECMEETGMLVSLVGEPYISFDSTGYCYVATYRAVCQRQGTPLNPYEGETLWVRPADITVGGFGAYNLRALRHFHIELD